MSTLSASAPIGTLGLPTGDHWVKFHVEGDLISFEVTASHPQESVVKEMQAPRKPTGFVEKWGGTVKKIEDGKDAWLAHINDKHLR